MLRHDPIGSLEGNVNSAYMSIRYKERRWVVGFLTVLYLACVCAFVAAGGAGELRFDWVAFPQLCVFLCPIYIYLIWVYYFDMHLVDFMFVVSPFILWLLFTIFIRKGVQSMTNGLFLEPGILISISGAYLVVFPL
jgi:hypothetical protein